MSHASTRSRLVRWGASAALVGGLGLGAVAVPAGAATRPTIDPAARAGAADAALAALQADGADAIAKRQAQLTKLGGKLAAQPACDTGGTQAALVTSDAAGLTSLGAKLAAETTASAAKDDVQSIFQDFRVYLVVTPQVYSTSACGHIQAATDRLTTIAATLSTRVDAAAAGGADMTAAKASLADLTAKVDSAHTAGTAAAASLSGIGPDHGDQSVLAANQAAVAAARTQLVGARTDLATAVADARSVVAALKAAG